MRSMYLYTSYWIVWGGIGLTVPRGLPIVPAGGTWMCWNKDVTSDELGGG